MKRTRTMKIAAVLVIFSILTISCGRSKRQRLAIAYVIDMTASVDADAVQQTFAALKPLLNSKSLKRGDTITIIPITGDTMTEAQGRILRIHLPENREVYDADLARLAVEVEEKLKEMQAEAAAHPYQHSDILGAADLAGEELSTEKGNVRKVIVILSDFIQDDARFNFNTSPDLTNERTATALAKKLSGSKHGLSGKSVPGSSQPKESSHATSAPARFASTTLYLGLLRSKDLKRMPPTRRDAVQAFWREYFSTGGAGPISVAVDGPGRVGVVIDQSN